MKLKRILAGALAGVMAITSMVVTSVTASAAADPVLPNVEYGTVMLNETSEKTITADDNSILQINPGTVMYDETDIVLISITTDATDTSDWEILLKGFDSNWGGWASVSSGTGVLTLSTTIKDVLDANSITNIDDFGGIRCEIQGAAAGDVVKYSYLVARDVNYVEPTYGVWEKNDDGKWEILLDGSSQPTLPIYFKDYGVTDIAEIASIKVDWTYLNGYPGGALCASQASDGKWLQAEWSNATTATLEIDGVAPAEEGNDASAQFQVWWGGKGTKIVINDVTITMKKYEVTVADDITNGTVTVDTTTAEKGDGVEVTAIPDDGFELVGITLNGETAERVSVDGEVTNRVLFEMPAENVEVSATFKEIEVAPTTYKVTVDSAIKNGTVTVDKTTAEAGDKVTVTVKPDDGYSLKNITVKYGENSFSVDENNQFVMPTEDVTVFATFTENSSTGGEGLDSEPQVFDLTKDDFVANKVVAQTKIAENGTKSYRFVMKISEADAKDNNKVTFTISNGTKEITKDVTNCYKEIIASGEKVAETDYVYVAYTITDVPENVALTATAKLSK